MIGENESMSEKYVKLYDAMELFRNINTVIKGSKVRGKIASLPTVEIPQWIPCSEKCKECEEWENSRI